MKLLHGKTFNFISHKLWPQTAHRLTQFIRESHNTVNMSCKLMIVNSWLNFSKAVMHRVKNKVHVVVVRQVVQKH